MLLQCNSVFMCSDPDYDETFNSTWYLVAVRCSCAYSKLATFCILLAQADQGLKIVKFSQEQHTAEPDYFIVTDKYS